MNRCQWINAVRMNPSVVKSLPCFSLRDDSVDKTNDSRYFLLATRGLIVRHVFPHVGHASLKESAEDVMGRAYTVGDEEGGGEVIVD
jgi:hypothetical protein